MLSNCFQVSKSNEVGKISRELEQLKLRYNLLEHDVNKLSIRAEGLEDEVATSTEQLDMCREALKAEQRTVADVSRQLEMLKDGYERWMVKAVNLSRQNEQLNREADERMERLRSYEGMLLRPMQGETHSESADGSSNLESGGDGIPEISAPVPPPVASVVVSSGGTPAVKAVRRKTSSNSADNKEREFMFVFSGQGIDFGVYGLDWRMQRIEYGNLDPTHKYCVMKLHRNFGRRRATLINVVNEYNMKARTEFQVALRLENQGGKDMPRLYTRKDGRRNPITDRLVADRRDRPMWYKAWSNRINKPPIGTVIVDEEEEVVENEVDTAVASSANGDTNPASTAAGDGLETEDDEDDAEAQGTQCSFYV